MRSAPLRLCGAAEDVDYSRPCWRVGSRPLTLRVSASSWFRGVEPDGRGLRPAAVPAGAVPEGGDAPAVHQQGARGHRVAALAQALQVGARFVLLLLLLLLCCCYFYRPSVSWS